MPQTAITLAQFVARFPEFATVTQDIVDALNIDADCFISEERFGENYVTGKCLLMAHLRKLAVLRGAGALISSRVGDESRTYAAPATGVLTTLASSSYGSAFLELARVVCGGGLFVNPQAQCGTYSET